MIIAMSGFADDFIHAEWLHAYPQGRRQVWFDRDPAAPGRLRFPDNHRGPTQSTLAELARPDRPFLSLASEVRHARSRRPRDHARRPPGRARREVRRDLPGIEHRHKRSARSLQREGKRLRVGTKGSREFPEIATIDGTRGGAGRKRGQGAGEVGCARLHL